jgi:hypothetical protein
MQMPQPAYGAHEGKGMDFAIGPQLLMGVVLSSGM